jgi:hypothetical protein
LWDCFDAERCGRHGYISESIPTLYIDYAVFPDPRGSFYDMVEVYYDEGDSGKCDPWILDSRMTTAQRMVVERGYMTIWVGLHGYCMIWDQVNDLISQSTPDDLFNVFLNHASLQAAL